MSALELALLVRSWAQVAPQALDSCTRRRTASQSEPRGRDQSGACCFPSCGSRSCGYPATDRVASTVDDLYYRRTVAVNQVDPYYVDNIQLTTVGIAIGSSTSHLMFSRLHLRRLGRFLSSRYVVIERQALPEPGQPKDYGNDHQGDQGRRDPRR